MQAPTKKDRLSPERFKKLKQVVARAKSRPFNIRGWKRNICREFNISTQSLETVLAGNAKKPPFTRTYRENDKQYIVANINGKSNKCDFCGFGICTGVDITADNSKYCSEHCKTLSLQYRAFASKEPTSFRLSKHDRQPAKQVYTQYGSI